MPLTKQIIVKEVSLDNVHFLALLKELDLYLANINGSANDFFIPFNAAKTLDHCMVAYDNEIAIGCGALKQIDNNTYELKRFYVMPPYRRLGIARKILEQLELLTQQNNGHYLRLETSKRMLSAVHFYHANGFYEIEKFEPYIGVEDSVCLGKQLRKHVTIH